MTCPTSVSHSSGKFDAKTIRRPVADRQAGGTHRGGNQVIAVRRAADPVRPFLTEP
jgi:hypothetical protein